MKILIGKLGLETNTFSVEEGTFARWSQSGCYIGQDMIKANYGKADYTSGMMRAAEELGAEVIPTISMLDAGPLMRRETVDYVMGILLDMVAANKEDIDGICFALHGAGTVEGGDDLESETLRRIRSIVGDQMPITITLDLHANLSEDMVALTQGIFGIKQYPHIDTEAAGYLAMRSLLALLQGKTQLYTGLTRMPLLVSPPVGNTFGEPLQSFTEYTDRFRAENGLLDATFFHGFPYIDRPILGASAVVVSTASQQDADEKADALAGWIWEHRAQLNVHLPDGPEAVDAAEAYLDAFGTKNGYVVLNEASDNPGGACPGDGTGLLRILLAHNKRKAILGYIHDEEMARRAHEAGVGARISGYLGGKTDSQHGAPVYVEDAYVCALSDGVITYNSPVLRGQTISYGKSARLRIGNTEVVVTEMLTQQTLDNMPFVMVGADIDQYEIVCVKSANHFRAYFEHRAAKIIPADTPGIHCCDLRKMPFTQINRPLYPLDPDMVWDVGRA